MANEPQELAANEWGSVTFYPEWNTLELKWRQKTRSMSDDGFKKTLRILAEQGLEVRHAELVVAAHGGDGSGNASASDLVTGRIDLLRTGAYKALAAAQMPKNARIEP